MIFPAAALAAKSALPADVRAAIKATRAAAKSKDWHALRALMVADFSWDFGGDADADAAIAEWKREPRYLSGLLMTIAKGCKMAGALLVDCPGRGDLSFRAGMVKQNGKWKWQYLVEGD